MRDPLSKLSECLTNQDRTNRGKMWHLLIGMAQCELIRGTGNELTEVVEAGRGA